MDGVDVESYDKKREYSKKWREKNKEVLKIKKKKYSERNKEKIKQKLREYYLSNKDKLKKKATEYKKKNRKKINENAKKWRQLRSEYLSEYNKQLYRKNKDKHKERRMRNKQKHREYHFYYKYNITMEEYNSFIIKQSNRCKICYIQLDTLDKKSVHLDHCHSSGKIRGILCKKCNSILGMCNDNPFILLNACLYLNEYN